MLGSANAPEPGFHPGALGSWHASGVLACAGGLWHALVGSGALGAWRALGALARAGGSARQNMAASELARFSPRRTLGALAHAAGSGARWGALAFPDD